MIEPDRIKVLFLGAPTALSSLPSSGRLEVAPADGAHTLADLRGSVVRVQPHVAVIGPGSSPAGTVTRAVRDADDRVRILVEAEPGDAELIRSVLVEGACGTLAPGASPRVVEDSIERAAAGELILDDISMRLVLSRLSDERDAMGPGRRALTPRETQVLEAVASGSSTEAIAGQLGIAPATVQAHVKNVLAKLGVHSKTEAVRLGWREGLIAIPA